MNGQLLELIDTLDESHEVGQFFQCFIAHWDVFIWPSQFQCSGKRIIHMLVVQDVVGRYSACVSDGVATGKTHVEALVEEPLAGDRGEPGIIRLRSQKVVIYGFVINILQRRRIFKNFVDLCSHLLALVENTLGAGPQDGSKTFRDAE